MSFPTTSLPSPAEEAGWTTAKLLRMSFWVAVKALLVVLLARGESTPFVYAGF